MHNIVNIKFGTV